MTSRRYFDSITAALAAAFAACIAGALSACVAIGDPASSGSRGTDSTVDLLIRGGTIYNGDDERPLTGDVGINGDRIAFVGKAPSAVVARKTIEATGLIVAPGFIDPHTHADADVTA